MSAKVNLSSLDAELANSIVDGVIIIDSRGIIQDMNQAVCDLFGYSREELIGDSVNLLMPSPYREKHDGFIQDYLRTGERKIIGIGREVPARHRNGKLFPAYLSVSVLEQNGEPFFLGVLHDLSEVNRAKQRIRELSHRIIEVQEEERTLIAREIHDDLGSSLFLMKMLIQQTLAETEKGDGEMEKIRGYMSTALNSVEDVIGKARAISHQLTPPGLAEIGLVPALQKLAEKFEEQYTVSINLDLECQLPAFNELQKINIYRIAQESLSNIAKHSGAKKIRVGASSKDGRFCMSIEDDGDGFDPARLPPKAGIGLKLMRERARLAGGELMIDSEPKKGTKVRFEYEPPYE